MKKMMLLVVMSLLLLSLAACGGSSAIGMSDVPAYPEATALVAGQDSIADTLLSNMEQDAALRGSMGVGGKIEQMAYRLPAGTSWAQVESFYKEKLEGDGWVVGMGGPGGDIAAQALASTNASNDSFQTMMWSRDNQVITVIRNNMSADELFLLISLNTN